MNAERVSQLFFDERYVVPVDRNARSAFDAWPQGRADAAAGLDAMATTCLLAVLEAACVVQLRDCVDPDQETVVGVGVECRHRGAVAVGASLRITGWVEGLGEREVTFRVQAHDEHEQVCEGSIRLAMVTRRRLADIIERKRSAIARRALFAMPAHEAA